MALNDDLLALEVTTSLENEGRTKPALAAPPAVVDPSWLTWVPARRM